MDEKVMIELRKVEVEILKEIHKICTENDLQYYLCGGTLLGAVRHKGFIPWDDDIDIVMPRDDYNKFITLCLNGKLDKQYILQNTDTEPEYHLPFTKIRKKHTFFDEEGVRKLKIHKGIFVDIFPLDYSKKNEGFCFNFKDKIIKNLIYVVSMRQLGCEAVSKVCKLLYFITKPLSVHRIIKISDFVSSHSKKGKYYVDYASYVECSKETAPIEYYGEPILLDFENEKFPAPCKYDFILEKLYGDYMKLPPEEERENHNAVTILFNTEEGEMTCE